MLIHFNCCRGPTASEVELLPMHSRYKGIGSKWPAGPEAATVATEVYHPNLSNVDSAAQISHYADYSCSDTIEETQPAILVRWMSTAMCFIAVHSDIYQQASTRLIAFLPI